MNRGTALFDEAERAVAGDETLLDRVRRARIQLDHQWLRGYVRYRLEAEEKGQPFGGPADLPSATEQFIARVSVYEGQNIRVDGAQGLDEYAAALRRRSASIANPPALPEQFRDVPPGRLVDVQEGDFWLATGATVQPDAKASNGFAAKMDPAVLSWSVQYQGIGRQLPGARWHVYASVRCEKVKDSGVAFTGGIYHQGLRKNLVGLSARIEDQGAPEDVDPNTKTEKTVTSQKGAGDGEYQLYDLGRHDLDDESYVWFGTTGGVSAENVKAIYVDRLIFVKEQ